MSTKVEHLNFPMRVVEHSKVDNYVVCYTNKIKGKQGRINKIINEGMFGFISMEITTSIKLQSVVNRLK